MWEIIHVLISYPALRKSQNMIGNTWLARQYSLNIVLYVLFSFCDKFYAVLIAKPVHFLFFSL